MLKRFFYAGTSILMLALAYPFGATTPTAQATDNSVAGLPLYLPYQSDGWRHMQVPHNDPLTLVFIDPSFDDSGWSLGQAAFGSGGGCPLDGTVNTPWALNTDMLLRRPFLGDPAIPVMVHVAIDNDVMVWVNGTLILDVTHDGCATLDNFNVAVPPAEVMLGGNVLAVRAIDRGGISFVDVRVEGDQPVRAAQKTWGTLKSLYR